MIEQLQQKYVNRNRCTTVPTVEVCYDRLFFPGLVLIADSLYRQGQVSVALAGVYRISCGKYCSRYAVPCYEHCREAVAV